MQQLIVDCILIGGKRVVFVELHWQFTSNALVIWRVWSLVWWCEIFACLRAVCLRTVQWLNRLVGQSTAICGGGIRFSFTFRAIR